MIKTIGTFVLAGAIVVGGAGAATASPWPPHHGGHHNAGHHKAGHGKHGHHMGLLHVEAAGKRGTFVFQRGEITGVAGAAVTVKSTDGLSWTWTVGEDTRIRVGRHGKAAAADLAPGLTVRIYGKAKGDVRTAKAVWVKPTVVAPVAVTPVKPAAPAAPAPVAPAAVAPAPAG